MTYEGKIFRSGGDVVTYDWRILHNEGVQNLYPSHNTEIKKEKCYVLRHRKYCLGGKGGDGNIKIDLGYTVGEILH